MTIGEKLAWNTIQLASGDEIEWPSGVVAPEGFPKTFAINLDGSMIRLAFITRQAREAGIAFERISATRGADIPEWLQSEFAGPHELTPGEIGCYCSHLRIAQRIVAEELPCALILEDDAILYPGFADAVLRAVEALPAGWDVLHLSSLIKRTVIEVAPLNGGRSLIRHTRVPVNAAAYLLSNRGARKILNPMQRIRPNDIDTLYWWLQDLDIYGVYPAPAFQDQEIESDVGHVQGVKETRSWSPSFMSRLRGKLLFIRRVGLVNFAHAMLLNWQNSLVKRVTGARYVSIIKQRRRDDA